jgi:hypothetical protein
MKKEQVLFDKMRWDDEDCPVCSHAIKSFKCENCGYPNEKKDIDGDSIIPNKINNQNETN